MKIEKNFEIEQQCKIQEDSALTRPGPRVSVLSAHGRVAGAQHPGPQALLHMYPVSQPPRVHDNVSPDPEAGPRDTCELVS